MALLENSSPQNEYAKGFFSGLRPDPPITVSEWADSTRMLTAETSSAPGRWRTDRTPYLREIMDSLSPKYSRITKIVFMKGSQVGGSECGINWLGSIIDKNPGPTLIVQPTLDLAKDFSKRRVDTMIEAAPELSAKIRPARERDSGNTITQKNFTGGSLRFGGANAAAGLRSMPIKNLFLDEVDAYPGDVEGEGDPVELATARTRTFARNKKIFLCSSPKIAGASRIEQAYLESDQRKFYVPCPHCDYRQEIKWPQIKWENDDPKTAYFECISCHVGIEEQYKDSMLAQGEWVVENPEGTCRGYHLSALYSPLGWFTWADVVAAFLAAKHDSTRLKGFINTILGETWTERGEAPEWERLYNRRESYDIGTMPEGAVVLTCGVDVQENRIEYEVVGWGRDKESWSIEYATIEGSTDEQEVWDKLLDVLVNKTWQTSNGSIVNISMMAVDTGFKTQRVYEWCRTANQSSGNRVMAIKGQSNLAHILGAGKFMDINFNGRTIKRGVQLFPVGVDLAKTEVYSRLKLEMRIDDDGVMTAPIGFCHFPEYGPEYFKMLTAEEKRAKKIKGRTVYEWHQTRPRNEALDCRVYNIAANIRMGYNVWANEHFDLAAAKTLENAPTSVTVERRKGKWLTPRR